MHTSSRCADRFTCVTNLSSRSCNRNSGRARSFLNSRSLAIRTDPTAFLHGVKTFSPNIITMKVAAAIVLSASAVSAFAPATFVTRSTSRRIHIGFLVMLPMVAMDLFV